MLREMALDNQSAFELQRMMKPSEMLALHRVRWALLARFAKNAIAKSAIPTRVQAELRV